MDQEFFDDIKDLLASDAVQRLKRYVHHKSGTRFDHSLYVAYRSYRFAKKMGWDSRAAARVAADYTVLCIEKTVGDPDHWYGVKFEKAIPDLLRMLEEAAG